MTHSGYVDGYERSVGNALASKRGRAFLFELRDALDAMPVKELISGDLINENGECCALGAVARARGMDVSDVDPGCREEVGRRFDIAPCMAAEIAFENDTNRMFGPELCPAERWKHMRRWVDQVLEDPRMGEV